MDYVNWVGRVLEKIVEEGRTSAQTGGFGLNVYDIAKAVHGPGATNSQTIGLNRLFAEMKDAGLLLETNSDVFYKPSYTGRSILKDPVPYWQAVCEEKLESDQGELLHLVNRLSPRVSGDNITLDWVELTQLLADLDWPDKDERLRTVGRELGGRGLAKCLCLGSLQLKASYQGLVWETRRGFTLEAKFIDGLVAEWETTSVEFKRELSLNPADRQAKFVKDLLGLANTQASGRRWMVVGFSEKTRAYHGPPDHKVSQNRIEQILSPYTTPNVEVRYEVVDYRAGKVGKLEVLRDARKLPYRVAKSVGDKKRIEEGQVFVRHGSQTEAPTPAELQAIVEEGERARLHLEADRTSL
ncbi:MAG: ATP-binding protein [Pyrinomonadaceae bacterium]|nr:ATP-binding protein [Pyrinomonadaceae bacterium]MDQ3258307.1 putative DNA binding domain-containing protein [Acidobacteriota bacterium]